ncbi:DUF4424 family protein [Escherichia albertii]
MRKLLSLLFFISSVVLANDSAVGEDNGTLIFLKQNNISMAKERLLIAKDRINVDYVFINHSPHDITVPVAFPMPALGENNVGDRSVGIANFKLSVNGKPVKTQSRWLAKRLNGQNKTQEDVTEILLHSGWTMAQWLDYVHGIRDPSETPPLPPEWFKNGYLQIEIQQYFIWQQYFPAGKEIIIHHSYTPSASGGEPNNLESILSNENYGDKCLTPATRKALKQLDVGIKDRNEDGSADIDWNNLSYILKTGANWKDGIIGDFTLRIHKNSESEVIVPCFSSPLKQIDPLTLEFTQKNFKPTENLDIHFYYDDSR